MSQSEPTDIRESGFSITTRRPVAILMVVMAICVFGWVSYQRLSLNLMPDISYPTLTVRTEYPGTAPEEVEMLLARPLEQLMEFISCYPRRDLLNADVLLTAALDIKISNRTLAALEAEYNRRQQGRNK